MGLFKRRWRILFIEGRGYSQLKIEFEVDLTSGSLNP